jgi:hypothetical protein
MDTEGQDQKSELLNLTLSLMILGKVTNPADQKQQRRSLQQPEESTERTFVIGFADVQNHSVIKY